MDPATAAGFVLGVLPLLISAVENYEITFQPFVTYRHHIREMRKFATRLDTQRAIFHNECQVLLSAVGQNLADALEDPQHPARNDAELSSRLESLLGNSCDICVSTVNLIIDTLEEVTRETDGFKDMLEGKKWKGKGLWTAFRQKMKISFGKTRLNDIVHELRLYNEDLGRLARQIRKLRTLSSQSSFAVTTSIVSNVQNTQKASIRLYDILSSGWSCEELVDHVATMSLKVEETSQNSASKVRFKMAVTCNQPWSEGEPLWLAIESAPNEPSQEKRPTNSSTSLQATLEKATTWKPRSVKFDLSPTVQNTPSPPPLPGFQNQSDPLVDLCTMGKLCWYFRGQRLQTSKEPCVGYLGTANAFKHLVYWDRPPGLTTNTTQSITLKSVLKSASEEGKQHDWVAKLKLARMLALSVLRFHSTPWLPESWGSDNVYLPRDLSSTKPSGVLEDPCLNVNLSAGSSNRHIRHENFRASVLATNEILYNLGIVLIELGHDAPFENLVESQESLAPRLSNIQVTNFLAARRLGESVHEKLNMTYGRVVEKCLNCNFGVTTKLRDPELQAAVVNHVVSQLDICLEQYRAFNTLAPSISS